MMWKCLTLFLVLACAYHVDALKCYTGKFVGLTSGADNNTFEKTTCSSISNTCLLATYYKTVLSKKIKVAVAECFNNALGCEHGGCPSFTGGKCNSTCCDTDYCNKYEFSSGELTKASYILMTGIVTLVFYAVYN